MPIKSSQEIVSNNKLLQILESRAFNVYSGVPMAILYGLFAYAHYSRFLATHDWIMVLVLIFETLSAWFFIVRSEPKTVSLDPYDWLVAVIGAFTPLFFRPAAWGVLPAATILIVLGDMLQLVSMLSLNRSFAIVAAKREIKTAWMYRIVRHPLYASYFLSFGGYVLVYTTLANLLVYTLMVGFLCARIFREERHLYMDPVYRAYMLDVRYRVIPFVF